MDLWQATPGAEASPPSRKARKRLRRIAASASRQRELLRREFTALGGEIAVQHGAATAGETGALLDHAGGDFRDVGNFRTAQPERIAGAHRLRFGAESKARGRRNRGDRG